MGQFEYSVPLSSVRPEDIERVAKEYMAKKELEKQEEENAKTAAG